MKTEFCRAELPRELRALAAFDRKVFPSDHFPASDWRRYESWWLLIADGKTDGKTARKIGCCAFELNVDFADDIRGDGLNPARPGSLYVASTGILPQFQNQGFGRLMKAWQVAWARRHGFNRMVTNTRKSNAAMIAVNRQFGFKILRVTPHYYRDPVEATVVMELKLRAPARRPAI